MKAGHLHSFRNKWDLPSAEPLEKSSLGEGKRWEEEETPREESKDTERNERSIESSVARPQWDSGTSFGNKVFSNINYLDNKCRKGGWLWPQEDHSKKHSQECGDGSQAARVKEWVGGSKGFQGIWQQSGQRESKGAHRGNSDRDGILFFFFPKNDSNPIRSYPVSKPQLSLLYCNEVQK